MHILNTMEYMKECSMIGCKLSLQNGHWYVSAPIFQQITVNAPAQRWIWTLCLHIWIYQYSSTFSNFSKVTHWSWAIRSDSLSSSLFWRLLMQLRSRLSGGLSAFQPHQTWEYFLYLPDSEHGSVMMLKQKRMSLKRLLLCWIVLYLFLLCFMRQWKQWLHIIYILTTKWTAIKVQLQEKVLHSVILSELTESGLQSTRSHYLFNKMFTF